MIKIKIQDYTKNPLTTMGMLAKECYNTELKDKDHAMRIAKHCINSGHGRNMEFADVTMTISGISARMGRELYAHVIGTSKTQASTRYITYDDFDYIMPNNMSVAEKRIYENCMEEIKYAYGKLKKLGVKNDITGYLLPLGMTTTINLKINVRALEHLANTRMCNRALKEFRDFMKILKIELGYLDEEWKWISDNLMKPNCMKNNNTCVEQFPCEMVKSGTIKHIKKKVG